ncbi:unnamed protein product [Cylindrotheca closterium]|uniref:Uncharacterized protein n=1 Tax=Cylindrotheca closterium TaxID=2856 RepID=A0AAD2PUN3_9STRA|nr:unnamed protein product [Cylindrotheca closterium]
MGCGSSKLRTVEDSVHVMLKRHDKKMRNQAKGQKPHGFVPRADHPLLKPKAVGASEEPGDDNDEPPSPPSAPTAETTNES